MLGHEEPQRTLLEVELWAGRAIVPADSFLWAVCPGCSTAGKRRDLRPLLWHQRPTVGVPGAAHQGVAPGAPRWL